MSTATPIMVGLDAGNGRSTLVYGTGPTQNLTIPSFVGSGTEAELRRIRAGSGATRELKPDDMVLAYNSRGHYVGRLALEQSADASSARGDVTRYWTGHTRLLLLALLGATHRQADLTVRVVTGLPYMVWTPENARRVQQCLLGTHTYIWRGEERRVTIEGVMVGMEGIAVRALMPQVNGPVAIADIGARTTEACWFENGEIVRPKSGGDDRGVEAIGDLLREELLARYDRDLSALEISNMLRSYARRERVTVIVSGRPIDITDLIAQQAQTVGSQIATFLRTKWRSGERGSVASEAAMVALVGGGAHYFMDALRSTIPQLTIPKKFAPELANAYAYHAIGAQLADAQWRKLR